MIRPMLSAMMAAGLAIASPALAQKTAEFEVGGVAFEVAIPEGFCLPSGRGANVAEMLARADDRNVTNLTLFACDFEGGSEYYLVKTPRAVLTTTITRPEFLKEMKKVFASPEFAAAITPDKVNDDTSRAIGGVVGQKVDVDSAVGPRGTDDSCAYVAGVVSMSTDGKTFDTEMSGCLTVVGGRVIMVYYYDSGKDAQRSLDRLPVARNFALSIRVKQGD